MNDADRANAAMYGDYYAKPAWWFRWRYDTQIKRKVCLALARRFRSDWSHADIFEIGFGSGATLCSFDRSCRLTGVEIAASAVAHATREAQRRGFSSIRLEVSDRADALPFPSSSQDLVIASHVLEHVPDDTACIRELHRLLRPGGALIVLVPLNERHRDPNHVRAYTTAQCRSQIESQGFTCLHAEENEWLYYLVESLYVAHQRQTWGPLASLGRIAFNLLTARLPLAICRLGDRCVAAATGLPARQAALLFRKT